MNKLSKTITVISVTLGLTAGCVSTVKKNQAANELPDAQINWLSPAEVNEAFRRPIVRLQQALSLNDTNIALAAGDTISSNKCLGANPFEAGISTAISKLSSDKIDIVHDTQALRDLYKYYQDLSVMDRRAIIGQDKDVLYDRTDSEMVSRRNLWWVIHDMLKYVTVTAGDCEPVTIEADNSVSGGIELSAFGVNFTLPFSADKSVTVYETCIGAGLYNSMQVLEQNSFTDMCIRVIQSSSSVVMGINFTDGRNASGLNFDFGISQGMNVSEINALLAKIVTLKLLSEFYAGVPLSTWFDGDLLAPKNWSDLQHSVRRRKQVSEGVRIAAAKRLVSKTMNKHLPLGVTSYAKQNKETGLAERKFIVDKASQNLFFQYVENSRFRRAMEIDGTTLGTNDAIFIMLREFHNIDPDKNSRWYGKI